MRDCLSGRGDSGYDDRRPADVPVNAFTFLAGSRRIFTYCASVMPAPLAFSRRVKVDLAAIGEVYVHSPEDLIVYKTWYFSLSQQTKHVRDIAAILRMNRSSLFSYIQDWMIAKGCAPLAGDPAVGGRDDNPVLLTLLTSLPPVLYGCEKSNRPSGQGEFPIGGENPRVWRIVIRLHDR